MRFRLPLFVVSALLLGLLAVPSAPANLSGTFKLKTGTQQTPGRAAASGRVTFIGDSHPYYQVRVRGQVNDICPGDGYSAVLEINYEFGGGSYRRRNVVDPKGCAAAAKQFVIKSPRFKHQLTSVAIVLHEIDHDANGIPVDYGDEDRQVFFP